MLAFSALCRAMLFACFMLHFALCSCAMPFIMSSPAKNVVYFADIVCSASTEMEIEKALLKA